MSPQSMYPIPSISIFLRLDLTYDQQSIFRLCDLSTISAKRIRRVLAQEFPNDEITQNKVS